MKTRDVKRLSRLPFIYGVKVSASRRVLGNYTKGAGHFKDKGEFGIYVGNAMLMFQVFKLEDGPVGRLREYWNRYLLHNELPVGVVSGPANVWPREWQRAWRACYSGDERLMAVCRSAFEAFGGACNFETDKTIACVKQALKLEGVIGSDLVAKGTPLLNEQQRQRLTGRYEAIRQALGDGLDPIWRSRS
jgi:dihydrodipicolinate synthase/N-acetylneuraminate lyase